MSVTIVTDLGFGDAGKGTVVDYLARRRGKTLVVRHCGGPQAGHNVITPDGRHHCFAQFGSGALAGAATFLSKFMLINPLNQLLEANHLQELGVRDIWDNTFVARNARIITPWHVAVNRSQRGAVGNSCGMGIGVAMQQDIERPDLTIHVADFTQPDLTERLDALRLHLQQQALCEEPGPQATILSDAELAAEVADRYRAWARKPRIVDSNVLTKLMAVNDHTIFEGSQGVLLDESHGFHPHTTWATTTHANAQQLIADSHRGPVTRIGVTRAYMTRHGMGPFPTEDPDLQFSEPHNKTGPWQGAFRQGHLDLALLRYAVAACGGIDQLAVTHLDRADYWQYSDSYDLKPADSPSMLYQQMLTLHIEDLDHPDYRSVTTDELLGVLNDIAPVSIASYGPAAGHKKMPVQV